jgi:hypothetical protein
MRRATAFVKVVIFSIVLIVLLLFAIPFIFVESDMIQTESNFTAFVWIVLLAFAMVKWIIDEIEVINSSNKSNNVCYNDSFKIELSYIINAKEYLTYILLRRLKEPAYYIAAWIFILVVPNILETELNTTVSVILMPILTLIIILAETAVIYKRYKRLTAAFKRGITYTITNETISITGDNFNQTFNWSFFKGIRVHKNFYILRYKYNRGVLLYKKPILKEYPDFQKFIDFRNSL